MFSSKKTIFINVLPLESLLKVPHNKFATHTVMKRWNYVTVVIYSSFSGLRLLLVHFAHLKHLQLHSTLNVDS